MTNKQSFEDELSAASLLDKSISNDVAFMRGARWALTESSIIREIEATLESIQASTSHPTTIMFISDALSKLKTARGEK